MSNESYQHGINYMSSKSATSQILNSTLTHEKIILLAITKNAKRYVHFLTTPRSTPLLVDSDVLAEFNRLKKSSIRLGLVLMYNDMDDSQRFDLIKLQSKIPHLIPLKIDTCPATLSQYIFIVADDVMYNYTENAFNSNDQIYIASFNDYKKGSELERIYRSVANARS